MGNTFSFLHFWHYFSTYFLYPQINVISFMVVQQGPHIFHECLCVSITLVEQLLIKFGIYSTC